MPARSGGYGDVLEREPAAVMEDLRRDAIRDWTARNVYGTGYDPETPFVDEEATRRAREEQRGRRLEHGRPYREFVVDWQRRRPPEQALEHFGAWPSGRPNREVVRFLTGRKRFVGALSGRGIAFAPLIWERLPELVRQPSPGWWRDPATGQRLLADAAALAGADALFVAAAGEAVSALRRTDARGGETLDRLVETPEARDGCALVAGLRTAAPFAVLAALPDAATLGRELGAEEPEAAEDALTDLARSHLDAGDDALAVLGSARGEVEAGARRVAAVGEFYRRPVLAVCGRETWFAGGADIVVATISNAGEWPRLPAGLVITEGDVSTRWNTDRLHAVGRSRP